jgi:anti-sigma factor RsiW
MSTPCSLKAFAQGSLATRPEDAARVGAWASQAEQIRARYAGITADLIPARLDLRAIGW